MASPLTSLSPSGSNKSDAQGSIVHRTFYFEVADKSFSFENVEVSGVILRHDQAVLDHEFERRSVPLQSSQAKTFRVKVDLDGPSAAAALSVLRLFPEMRAAHAVVTSNSGSPASLKGSAFIGISSKLGFEATGCFLSGYQFEGLSADDRSTLSLQFHFDALSFGAPTNSKQAAKSFVTKALSQTIAD